ncbi:hypothetical protein Tco_1410603 [Tanacetum coccineum]
MLSSFVFTLMVRLSSSSSILEFVMTLLIPGPKSQGKDIYVYLRPLIDDLKVLWALKGVETIDVATGQKFNMRAMRRSLEFNGEIEDGDPPRKFNRDQIHAQLDRLATRVKGKHPSYGGVKIKRNVLVELNWTKRSIFYELEHRQGKTRLEKVGHSKWLGQTKNRKCSKPQAAYSFTPENRKKFCEFIKGVKLPDGFGSNFKHKVTDNDTNITGLKSHDCHIMMQHLLPYGLQQYLPDEVAKPIIELCLFFKQICSATLMEDDMLKAQIKVVAILCNLELIYPPAFFDIMTHLVIHLPLEALEGGPILPRWMFPFERFMKTLKGYIRNKAKPEGSIAEGYVVEEALTFSSYYFQDVTMKFNRPDRNVDPSPNVSVSSIPVDLERHANNLQDPELSTTSRVNSLLANGHQGHQRDCVNQREVDAPPDIIDVLAKTMIFSDDEIPHLSSLPMAVTVDDEEPSLHHHSWTEFLRLCAVLHHHRERQLKRKKESQLGGVKAGRKTRERTRNQVLKDAVAANKGRPIEIGFEDRADNTVVPTGPYSTQWGNYFGDRLRRNLAGQPDEYTEDDWGENTSTSEMTLQQPSEAEIKGRIGPRAQCTLHENDVRQPKGTSEIDTVLCLHTVNGGNSQDPEASPDDRMRELGRRVDYTAPLGEQGCPFHDELDEERQQSRNAFCSADFFRKKSGNAAVQAVYKKKFPLKDKTLETFPQRHVAGEDTATVAPIP